jgi:hypothetical protein
LDARESNGGDLGEGERIAGEEECHCFHDIEGIGLREVRFRLSWSVNGEIRAYNLVCRVKSSDLLDIFGRKLLRVLQRDARCSIAELSRQIGLSQTRTEDSRIRQGYTVEIDPIDHEALGLLANTLARSPTSKRRAVSPAFL